MEPELADLGDGGRRQQGNHQALSHQFARARDGRRLAGRVVADPGDRPPERRRPRQVAVSDGVGRPVEPRILAVPESGHPAVAASGELDEELSAGHRGGRQFLVQAGAHHDAGRVEQGLVSLHLEVETAEWGTFVTADERGGVQAPTDVQTTLVEDGSDDGVDARQQDPPLGLGVLVLQRHPAFGVDWARNQVDDAIGASKLPFSS